MMYLVLCKKIQLIYKYSTQYIWSFHKKNLQIDIWVTLDIEFLNWAYV